MSALYYAVFVFPIRYSLDGHTLHGFEIVGMYRNANFFHRVHFTIDSPITADVIA